MSLTPDKLKALFEDLGKPTMRGVRKCPKCGTLNGTRGISCKNKDCDVVFKEREKKKGHSADAVKILTGSNSQLFSVRLRDRGPDYRGLVQFPAVHDFEGNPAVLDSNVLAQTAHCYVDTCSRSQQSPLGSSQQPCTHIRGALACEQEAEPLTLKNSVLNTLPVSSETKQAIWLLATETAGPLVQRVTKNIMVVKCKSHSKQPLGFLHFSFFETSRNRAQPEHKFQCSCKAFKTLKMGAVKEDSQRRCVHFYACICAFSSDDQLADEFVHYISLVHTSAATILSGQLITIVSQPDEQAMVALATTAETVDVMEEETSVEVIIDEDGVLTASEPKRQRVDDLIGGTETVVDWTDRNCSLTAQASSALLTLQDGVSIPKKPSPVKQGVAKPVVANVKKTSTTSTPLNELSINLSFHQWLASVTERINQSMHYQFDGSPEPLVFHASQGFFDCLQQRISAGNKKKRLPNSTTGFVRRDALPLGMFTKYTWNITNILHVKQIFDTAEMPLEITRSFVENHDGTFDTYETPSVDGSETPLSKNQPPIRPFELKTYIKVGNTSADQKVPTPFIIEWIPNILPKSHIGELRIKFEYGHQRNGQIEHRTTTGSVEVQTIHIQ